MSLVQLNISILHSCKEMYGFRSYACLWLILCALMEGIATRTLAKPRSSVASPITPKNNAQGTKSSCNPEEHIVWNYCMLGIALLVLIFGFVILWLNPRAKMRKKKIIIQQPANIDNIKMIKATRQLVKHQSSESDDEPLEVDLMLPTRQTSIPQRRPQRHSPGSPKPGEILIRWKDGDIGAILLSAKEDMV
eukprot:gi/632938195/ref/XP_007904104.1/ PREDICTED: organic solute transporter subunit beta-like isoform X2 [Callorhinchus milii]